MANRMPLEQELRIRSERLAELDRIEAERERERKRGPQPEGNLRTCECGAEFIVTGEYSGPECVPCRQQTWARNMNRPRGR